MARRLALVALALMAIGAFEPFYFRLPTLASAPFRARMTELQYSKLPGLRRFYGDVRGWTRPGERVAIWPTLRPWNRGYEYLHSRALYPLTGRVVLELVRPDDRFADDNLARADVIAAWNADPHVDGFVVAQRSGDGVLLRRAK